MPRMYRYQAKDLMGNDVNGILEGVSEQDIVNQLRVKDMFVISVAASDQAGIFCTSSRAATSRWWRRGAGCR